MPCRDPMDWDVTPHRVERHGMDLADFEAALCGVFTAAEEGAVVGGLEGLLDVVDWKEAGVQRRVVKTWWRKHKAEDEARRAREAEEMRTAVLKAAALSKLTAEERAALGLK